MKQATEEAKKKGKQDKKLKKKLSTIDENDDNSDEPKTYEVNDSDEDGGAKKGEDGPRRRN